MAVTDSLRKDHEAIRRRLELLEAALPLAANRTRELRRLTHALAADLERHIQEEERVLGPVAGCLCEARRRHLMTYLWRLIAELREHMEEEERDLYGVADRWAAAGPARDDEEAVPALAESDIDELGLA
jgi:hemerythrin-like domain-containing protein